MSEYIHVCSVSSGTVIRTFRSTLFGAENISPEAAIDNQLMYQELKKLIKEMKSKDDDKVLYPIAPNSEYSIRGSIGGKKSYIAIYVGKVELAQLGFCSDRMHPYILDVWQDIGGQGLPPTPPYTAIKLQIDKSYTPSWLVKFTKILSWAIYDQSDLKNTQSESLPNEVE